jgi:hypothetical protein
MLYRPKGHPPGWKRNPIKCPEGCHDICNQQVENPRKDEEPCDRGVFTESGEGTPAEAEAREEGVVKRIARGAKLTLPAKVDVKSIRKRLR